MDNRKNILCCPIKCEAAGVIVGKRQKDDRHEIEDPLLRGIPAFRGDDHLPDHGERHDQRKEVDREAEDVPDGIRLREVGDPEKRAVTELDRGPEHGVETEEDRDLDEHRDAAAEGIYPILAVELHRLLVHLLRVVFVFFFQLRHLGREGGHLSHLVGRLVLDRPESGFEDEREDNDRGGVVSPGATEKPPCPIPP